MRGICLVFLLFLCSCGSSVTISSSGCKDVRLASEKEIENSPRTFSFEHILWSGGFFEQSTYRTFSNIFEAYNISCREVEALSYSFEDRWQDIFVGFIPLINRQTISIHGLYREQKSP